jgi:hypothetical protein
MCNPPLKKILDELRYKKRENLLQYYIYPKTSFYRFTLFFETTIDRVKGGLESNGGFG